MAQTGQGWTRGWLFVGIVIAAGFLIRDAPVTAQAPAADPKTVESLTAREAALKARKWEAALNAFKQAHEPAGKSSAVVLFGMARAYHGLGAYKNEAASCLDALKFVGGDTALEANLHNQRGMALYTLAEKNTDKVLKD